MANLAPEHIAPPDQQNSFGWTPSLEVGPYSGRLHVAGSVGLGIAATFLASALYGGAGGESDRVPTLHWNTTDTKVQVVGNDVATNHEITHTIITREGTRRIAPPSLSLAVRMADAPSFSLDPNRGARDILNPTSFGSVLDTVAQRVREGGTVVRFNVDGSSSDETRLNSQADIGEPSAKNESVAQQYGDIVAREAVTGLHERGVDLRPDTIHSDAHEHVSSKPEIAEFAALATAEGLPNNLALIERYKQNPDSLSERTVQELKKLLDDNRGATITFTFAPENERVAETIDSQADRCVTTVTTTQVTENTQHPHRIPFVLIPPLPFVHVRRTRPKAPKTPIPPVASEPEPVLEPASQPVQQVSRPVGLIGGFGTRWPRPSLPSLRIPEITLPSWTDKAALVSAAGLVVAAACCIRADVGYCPNPNDHSNQQMKWGGAPDYVGLFWHNPITHRDTGQLSLSPVYCDPPGSPAEGGLGQTAIPECDTRQIVIRDGKLVGTSETHYPGATHVTTVVVPG